MIINVLGPLFFCGSLLVCSRAITRLGLVYFVGVSIGLLIYCNFMAYLNFLYYQNALFISLGIFIDFHLLVVAWDYSIDFIASNMLLIISIVACGIFLYSIDYMFNDPHLMKFIVYLYLFISFMFMLVASANLVVMFVGWEGVGLCSYLLISFWGTRLQALKASLKAILFNKIGDVSYLAGCAFLFFDYRTLDFSIIKLCCITTQELSLDTYWDLHGHGIYNVVGDTIIEFQIFCIIFFLIAVCAKSAQIGLHSWLPAAIEGPTPVSALIHAATIVTAGIILLLRLFELVSWHPNLIMLCAWIGSLTAVLSACTALFLFDIKRIIAYSTCSQLGYILASIGLYAPEVGFNHLLNHAFFKALLFLTAGSIIHAFNNEQDIRYLKQAGFKLPIEYMSLVVGNICIIGIPFFSGYYSKDLILETSYVIICSIGFNWIYFFLLMAAFGTSLYSGRIFFELFIIVAQSTERVVQSSGVLLRLVLSVLSGFSVSIGYVMSDYFQFNMFFSNIITVNSLIELELLGKVKLFPLVGSILLLLLLLSPKVRILNVDWKWSRSLKQIFISNYFFNEHYNLSIVKIIVFANTLSSNLDKGSLELVGPTGLSRVTLTILFKLQTVVLLSFSQYFYLWIYALLLLLSSVFLS